MKRKVACLLSFFFLVSCGSSTEEETDATSTIPDVTVVEKEELPLVTRQERYTPADFLSKVEADPDLQALWNQLQDEGYVSIEEAGISEQDDGVVVIWSEAAGPGKELRGLVRHCSADDCTSAIWWFSGGAVKWRDASGKEIEPLGMGLPILLKQLEGHTYDKPTHVVEAPLSDEEMPEIDVSKRRFYLLSSFGPLWANGALSTSALKKMAEDSGSFDEVLLNRYVRLAEADTVLLHSHPHDVFVWLGQTIREEAKTNEIFKPVGMTVNSGVFGDKLYDRARMDDKLDINPLHGPGLMVLAGCETMGDGNGGGEVEKSIPVVLDNKVRTLAGFKKCGDARDILEATHLFVDHYFSGSSLGESLAAANAYLAGVESKLTMATLPDADTGMTFVQDLSKYWEKYADDGPPGDSFFSGNLNIVNMCEDKEGGQYQENESFATAWCKDIKWEGPFFSCSRKNPDNLVDFEISGALKEIVEGAHFFFVVTGSLNPRVQGLTLYADAVIKEIVLDKEKPNEFIVEFKGVGEASPYKNEAGDTCQMQDPLLQSTTGEPGTFKIPVTWKNKDEE